jgi:hypothetical protein
LLDAAEQQLVDDVAAHGWHLLKVFSASDAPDEPPFAYTIGLEASYGWPELLCCGLAPETNAALIRNAIDELRGGAGPPAPGLALREVAEGVECRLSPVAPIHHEEHLGFAMWFAAYRGKDPRSIECLQLLWPDRNGRFPDEDGCSEGVKVLQPVLAR